MSLSFSLKPDSKFVLRLTKKEQMKIYGNVSLFNHYIILQKMRFILKGVIYTLNL